MENITSTKMGANKFAENTPNAPKFICPICLPKPKKLGFQWKTASLGIHSLCYITMDRYFGFEQLGNADELGPCGWVWRLASFMNFDGMQ